MGKQQGNRGQRPTGRDVRGGRGARSQQPRAPRGRQGAEERACQRASRRGAAKPSPGAPARKAPGRPTGADRAQGRPAPGAVDVIEGRRAAAEALRSGFPVKRALIAEGSDRDATVQDLMRRLADAGVPIARAPRAELDARSSHGAHQGVMLEVGSFPYAALEDVVARAGDGPALVVVLDHVTDAGNFGAIVRSAEVVGAAGVVIANRRAAEVNVGAYKTSAGAVMHLPIAQVPNIARAVEDLKAAGFWAVGASEHAQASCWDTALEGRIALVMGSEGDGISRLVLEACDDLTKLPQVGVTESLNVAQATTALCYEWLRRNMDSLPQAD